MKLCCLLQLNLLVVVLGLWSGMVLLPVMLSLIGPAPYLSAMEDNQPGETENNRVSG